MLKRWSVIARAGDPSGEMLDIELEATGKDHQDVSKVVESTLTLYRYKNISIKNIESSRPPSEELELPGFEPGCETWDENQPEQPLPLHRREYAEVLYFTVSRPEEREQSETVEEDEPSADRK